MTKPKSKIHTADVTDDLKYVDDIKLLVKQGKLKIYTCPCCGNNKLYIGPLDAMTTGIKCSRFAGGCGLEIGRGLMNDADNIPAKIRKQDGNNLKATFGYLLKITIKAWNKRIVNQKECISVK